MQRVCKENRRPRYVVAILMASLMLTGCAPALAGTSVNTGAADVSAHTSANVTWFDGQQIREADITISALSELSAMPFTPDISLIPLTETSQLKCFKITSTSDIDGLYDMQLLDINKQPILHVRTLYDGGVYSLGNNWYGVILPNGYSETSLLRIGNTYFEVN